MKLKYFFKTLLLLAGLVIVGCSVRKNQTSSAHSKKSGKLPAGVSLPAKLPQPAISGNIPLTVNVPSGLTSEEARPWFDQFSWQMFIALNWPVESSNRGVPLDPNKPSTFLKPPAGSSTVWSTYREAYELFNQGKNRPVAWNSDKSEDCPCGDSTDKSLMMVAKGAVLDEINEAFSFPIIDQNRNYAYSEVRFNKQQYEFIRGTDGDKSSWLYLMKNLAKKQPINMPASTDTEEGSIMLKATWRILTDEDDKSRYYSLNAQIYDPETKKCSVSEVGLVGFHIVQKLGDFPQWIWSSFEQVDNLERGHGATASTPISFNNGTNSPQTTGGWANRPPAKVPPLKPVIERLPTQITRYNPIPTTPKGASTVDLNKVYQQMLKGTPFEYYQLVITQWPSDPGQFVYQSDGGVYPKDCGQAFPANGCTNTVMETYFQSPTDAAGSGGNSCMSCHYGADKSDFSWVLQLRAH